MKKVFVACLIVMMVSTAALAVDLVNKDSQSYDVKIHSVGTTHTSISGSTTRISICSDCEIEVVNVGKVQASGDEKVVIENGSLKKE